MNKQTKETLAKAKAAQAKGSAFVPQKGLSRLERGDEFFFLQGKRKSIAQIIAIYKKHGIHLAVPTVYNAMRIATAMRDVHYVLHAPQGDTYADLLFTMIERRDRRPPPPMPYGGPRVR